MSKRRVQEVAEDADDKISRKTRRTSAGKNAGEEVNSPSVQAETPSKRKSILKGTPTKEDGHINAEPTPKSLRKVLFSTPNRPAESEASEAGEQTPTATRNYRSARRKSARALQVVDQESSDGDAEETAPEAQLARQILQQEASEDEDKIEVAEPSSANTTPSKRGRPKGRQRQRTPSPPPDLPPHELYFFQNRGGANKTSANTLPSHLLLHHEDYFAKMNAYKDPHEQDIQRLRALHTRAFEQWIFELDEGFGLCLYGYGSKRELVMEFAEYMYAQAEVKMKIVVVNGYTPGLTLRDILNTLSGALMPKGVKLPAQPAAMLDLLLTYLDDSPPKVPTRLIIHSLDHQNLRKHQALLAQLAASPHISLLATVDTPTFALLWDTSLLRHFNWLHHDATTFQPYTAEIDVVDTVNELLGRSGRRLGGKDGVAFVLKSLPENAKALFRILVAEQLAQADTEADAGTAAPSSFSDDEDILGASDEDAAAEEQNTPSRRKRGRKPKAAAPKIPKPSMAAPEGVEYRTLYHKAVEEFVCSSELNFRTLLKEFHDHQMVESRKDAMGTERMVVPFRREELETILEELVG